MTEAFLRLVYLLFDNYSITLLKNICATHKCIKFLELKCKLFIIIKFGIPLTFVTFIFLSLLQIPHKWKIIFTIQSIFLLSIIQSVFFKTPEHTAYVYAKNKSDNIVGFLEYDNNNWVTKWFVHPSYQGQGIGKKLVSDFINKRKEFHYESYPWYDTDSILKNFSKMFKCKHEGIYRHCKKIT